MIFLLGNKEDTLCQAVFERLTSKRKKFAYIHFRKIFKSLKVEDYLDSDRQTVTWKCGRKIISDRNVTGFFNRAPYVTVKDVQEFQEEDQSYVALEYLAYLYYALGKFQNAMNCVQPSGLHGIHLSFIEQFQLAQKNGLRTPDFLITEDRKRLGAFIRSNKNQLVFRDSIYSYRRFAPNFNENLNDTIHPLPMVVRPAGKPVICHIVGHNCICTDIKSNKKYNLSEGVSRKIIFLTKELKLNFADVLLFVKDPLNPSFGYITPWPEFEHISDENKEVVISLLISCLENAYVN